MKINQQEIVPQKKKHGSVDSSDTTKTRKKREELSISATKCIKKENVKIMVKFN